MRYGSLNALNKLTLQFKTLEDEKAYLKAALQQVEYDFSNAHLAYNAVFGISHFELNKRNFPSYLPLF